MGPSISLSSPSPPDGGSAGLMSAILADRDDPSGIVLTKKPSKLLEGLSTKIEFKSFLKQSRKRLFQDIGTSCGSFIGIG